MKKLICILTILLPRFLAAQPPIAFERYYDFGIGNSEEGFCVQQTFDGGYIVAGRQIQGIGFSKMLLHKVDSLGNTQWTKFIGSAYDNEAYAVKQTSDSGYILTGFTTDVNYTNFLTLVKTDANGNVIWSKNNISPIAALPQGGPGGGRGTDVLQTADGGYAVIANITDWDTSSVSIFIRTDMNGDTLWSKKHRRFAGIGINSLRQTLDSNFILTGRVTLTITPILTFGIYLIKANSIGDTLWTKIYTDPSTNNIGANTVVQTSDSGFFLSGYVYYSSSFSTDFFVLKTDQMGDTVWTRKIGGAGNEGGGTTNK